MQHDSTRAKSSSQIPEADPAEPVRGPGDYHARSGDGSEPPEDTDLDDGSKAGFGKTADGSK